MTTNEIIAFLFVIGGCAILGIVLGVMIGAVLWKFILEPFLNFVDKL